MPELLGSLRGDGAPHGFALDVVGIGALNLDYIANASALAEQHLSRSVTGRLSGLLQATVGTLTWGTEHSVNADTIHAAIEAVSAVRPDTALGGSAFNAIHAMAKTQAGLRLGYVGVAGRVPVIGLSTMQTFQKLGVDHRFVR
ncbi:MAG TPA: hypothetical protein VJX10_17685, partial [Pseudonocardiaceae bacterium]|nr:hypothetical protein [Pseudonocardiaceae bacterium]